MTDRVIFRARRAVLSTGVTAASVYVRGGRIERVAAYEEPPAGARVIDAGDALLLPGLVDTHVHINEPGRTEWEGFETATLAAAAGGVTTLVDMPLNSIPATTTVAALEAKRAAAGGRTRVDVAFWGGLVRDNLHELEPLAEAGVAGFKCFLVPSGVAEFTHVGEAELRRALPMLARLQLPLLVHAEDPSVIERAAAVSGGDPRAYRTWLLSRPARAEVDAVQMLVRVCRDTGAQVHVVHVSAADAAGVLRAARAQGLPISAETCPHYLHFAAEQIAHGATAFKCAPPIRGAGNRERLWASLHDGTLDMIVTDHSPCAPPLEPPSDFSEAWGGISSLQLGLSAVWTEANSRGARIEDVVRWMAAAPARLAGLGGTKGTIATGADADLVIFDSDARWTVEPERLHHRHALTPWAGEKLLGRVLAVYLRGDEIYRRGAAVGAARGRLLTRGTPAWTSPT